MDQLAAYASSSDDDDQPPKQPSNMPVPSSILSLYDCDKEDARNKPDDHQGRARSFPHERGNWSTFVYIPITGHSLMDDVRNSFLKIVRGLREKLDFHFTDSLHVSVSRTFVLKHHWIKPFMQSLQVACFQVGCFVMDLMTVEVFTNDEKTRTFVSLTVELPHAVNELKRVTSVVDRCLTDYNLQSCHYYNKPRFHVSLLWTLGDKAAIIRPLCHKLQDVVDTLRNSESQFGVVQVDSIACKSGNKQYIFQLNDDK